MNTTSPKVGIYLVLNTFTELIDGRKCPIAEVQFKEPHWQKLGTAVFKIRLRSLYYEKSIGPKHLKPDELHFLLINILNLESFENPSDRTKLKFKSTWEIMKPEGYEERKQMDSDLLGDFLLAENDEELEMAIADFHIQDMEIVDNENIVEYIQE